MFSEGNIEIAAERNVLEAIFHIDELLNASDALFFLAAIVAIIGLLIVLFRWNTQNAVFSSIAVIAVASIAVAPFITRENVNTQPNSSSNSDNRPPNGGGSVDITSREDWEQTPQNLRTQYQSAELVTIISAEQSVDLRFENVSDEKFFKFSISRPSAFVFKAIASSRQVDLQISLYRVRKIEIAGGGAELIPDFDYLGRMDDSDDLNPKAWLYLPAGDYMLQIDFSQRPGDPSILLSEIKFFFYENRGRSLDANSEIVSSEIEDGVRFGWHILKVDTVSPCVQLIVSGKEEFDPAIGIFIGDSMAAQKSNDDFEDDSLDAGMAFDLSDDTIRQFDKMPLYLSVYSSVGQSSGAYTVDYRASIPGAQGCPTRVSREFNTAFHNSEIPVLQIASRQSQNDFPTENTSSPIARTTNKSVLLKRFTDEHAINTAKQD